ncbi:rod shape-determining protein RodA [Sphingobacterium sp. E70]|nr:rod shape-determining protein RodA [Sphingobacterium sp. E70]ULT22912.1 rod shape-determining protein RodA [Sphingobacterium sp. E70]
MLANFLSAQSNKAPTMQTLAMGAGIVLFPVFLVMLQPDTGSALAFFSLIFVFYREGYVNNELLIFGGLCILLFVLALLFNPWILILVLAAIIGFFMWSFRKKRKYIINLSILFAACTAFILCVDLVYDHVLQPHQRDRIDIILGKTEDLKGKGYNLNQSKIAIGSGQFWGKGYLQERRPNITLFPSKVLTLSFAQWGRMGLCRFSNINCHLSHAALAYHPYCRTTAFGFRPNLCLRRGFYPIFHLFINIGMTIGIIPVIGIPLPFVSYGGSSLWSFTILLFIMLKFDSNRKGVV